MTRFIPLFGCIVVLSSCAYMQDSTVQDLTIETPGASNALCLVEIEGLRYRVRPPQTISVFKSREDLIVDCMAPGNRREKVVISPDIADSVAGNVVTGPAGLAWDYASAAMFRYPSRVTVDFTYSQIKPEAMPAQNSPDVMPPESYKLEEFLPSQPLLNADSDRYTAPLKRRERPGASTDNSSYMVETGGQSRDKGDLQAVLPSDGDPDGSVSAVGAPVSLYPGQ